eukprot:69042_1
MKHRKKMNMIINLILVINTYIWYISKHLGGQTSNRTCDIEKQQMDYNQLNYYLNQIQTDPFLKEFIIDENDTLRWIRDVKRYKKRLRGIPEDFVIKEVMRTMP